MLADGVHRGHVQLRLRVRFVVATEPFTFREPKSVILCPNRIAWVQLGVVVAPFPGVSEAWMVSI